MPLEELDVSNHPQIRAVQQLFTSRIDKTVESLQRCNTCKERCFGKRFRRDSTTCTDCEQSLKKNGCYKFAAANLMDPFPDQLPREPRFSLLNGVQGGYPHWLTDIWPMEEMLLARVHVVMKSYILKNGSFGYRGHCLNVEQDLSNIYPFVRLPHRPQDLPILIIRKANEAVPEGYKDFRVRRQVVSRLAEFLAAMSPNHGDIEIVSENFQLLPENGSVAHQLPTAFEQEEAPTNGEGGDPQQEDDDDVGPEDEQQIGPFQNGASGAPAEENQVEDTHMGRPILQNEQQRQMLENLLRERFGSGFGTAEQPAPWPAAVRNLSDYGTPGIQAMAFPTLFPYGCGDATKKDRRVEVTLTDANQHLLNYAVWDPEREVWFYPFAKHSRWAHWSQNTAERHRANGQKSVWLSKTNEAANLTEEDMANLVQQGGAALDQLLGGMQAFNANINGSNAYLHKWKTNLEALMEQEGMCSFWFSLSMADNHWDDLHRALDPKGSERGFVDEAERAKWKRKMARENPHLVDDFFFRRLKIMFETFFGSEGFETLWHWLRGELQGRGVYHGHGCARLKHDTGFAQLAETVFRGRQAQQLAELHDIELEVWFPDSNTCDDEWANDPDLDDRPEQLGPLSAEEIEGIKDDIRQGIDAEKILCCFQTLLLSTWHPSPPVDAAAAARNDSTNFVQGPDNIHPAAEDGRESDGDIGPLLDAVNRHLHQPYCQSKKKQRQSSGSGSGGTNGAGAPQPDGAFTDENCRFDYAKDICDVTHVVVKEYVVKKRNGAKEKRVKLEIKPRRNDKWLNSHMPHLMEVWRANMDMQLTIDLGKVIGYMTKYVTKSEASMTRGAQRMVARILCKTMEDGRSVHSALKRAMGGLLGERTMPIQEKCHLIMSIPTVFCSHSFVTINMANDSSRLILRNDQEGPDAAASANEQQAGRRVALMTLMDAYQCCLDQSKWLNEDEYNNASQSLPEMDFRTFAIRFAVGERGAHRNKIKRRVQEKTVVVFKPRLSSDPQSPTYTQYCRHALMKYKPWAGQQPSSLWGGEDATDADIQSAWSDHLESYAVQGLQIPDFIRKEIEAYHSNPPPNQEEDPPYDPPAELEELEQAEFCEELYQQLDNEDADDPDEVDIQWAKDHDWSVPEQEYPDDLDLDATTAEYIDLLKNFVVPIEAAEDEGIQLNEMQRFGRDMIVDLVKSEDVEGGGKLGILNGKGGTGKSTTINAAVVDLEEEFGVGCAVKLATTGMAATVIGGATVHSKKNGLGLPVGRQKFKRLEGKPLERLMLRFVGKRLIVIDEYSMLRQKELYYLHLYLQQAAGNQLLFGGFAILLVGDPAQIPAVLGRCMWETRPGGSQEDDFGHEFYKAFFSKVIELVEVRRVVGSVEAASFLTQLDRLQAHETADECWDLVVNHSHFQEFLLKATVLPQVREALSADSDAADFLADIDGLRSGQEDGQLTSTRWNGGILLLNMTVSDPQCFW